jgi:hypothetical protein
MMMTKTDKNQIGATDLIFVCFCHHHTNLLFPVFDCVMAAALEIGLIDTESV